MRLAQAKSRASQPKAQMLAVLSTWISSRTENRVAQLTDFRGGCHDVLSLQTGWGAKLTVKRAGTKVIDQPSRPEQTG